MRFSYIEVGRLTGRRNIDKVLYYYIKPLLILLSIFVYPTLIGFGLLESGENPFSCRRVCDISHRDRVRERQRANQ